MVRSKFQTNKSYFSNNFGGIVIFIGDLVGSGISLWSFIIIDFTFSTMFSRSRSKKYYFLLMEFSKFKKLLFGVAEHNNLNSSKFVLLFLNSFITFFKKKLLIISF